MTALRYAWTFSAPCGRRARGLRLLWPLFAAFFLGDVSPDRAADVPVTARRPKLTDLFADDVLARGKGVEVRRSQLEETFTAYRATLAARGQGITEDKR